MSDRAVAAARPIDHAFRDVVDREDVVAVDELVRNPVRRRALVDSRDRHLLRDRASSTRTCCLRRRRPAAASARPRNSAPRGTRPVLVAPSPIHAIATSVSAAHPRAHRDSGRDRNRVAEHADRADDDRLVVADSPALADVTMWMFRSRPRELASPFAMYWRKISFGRTPIVISAPMLRMSGRTASVRSSA